MEFKSLQIGALCRRWANRLACVALLILIPVISSAQALPSPLGLPKSCRMPLVDIAPGSRVGATTNFEIINQSSSLLTLYHVDRAGGLNFPTFVKPGITTYEHNMGGGDFSYILVTPGGRCIGDMFRVGPGTSKKFEVSQFTREQGQFAKQRIEKDHLNTCPDINADSARLLAPPSEQPELTIVNETRARLTYQAYGADGALVHSGTIEDRVNSLMPSHLTERGLRVRVVAPNDECIGGILRLEDETATEIRLTKDLSAYSSGSGGSICLTDPSHLFCPGSAFCKANSTDPNCISDPFYTPPPLAPSPYCIANPGDWLCKQNPQYPGPSPAPPPAPSAYCLANPSVWICTLMPQYPGPSNPPVNDCSSVPRPAHCAPTAPAPTSSSVTIVRLIDELCPRLETLKLASVSKHGFLRNATFLNNTRSRLTVSQIHEKGRIADWKQVNPGDTVTFKKLDKEPQQFMISDTRGLCMGAIQTLRNVGTTNYTVLDLVR